MNILKGTFTNENNPDRLRGIIRELQGIVVQARDENKRLQKRIKELTEENGQLSADLQETLDLVENYSEMTDELLRESGESTGRSDTSGTDGFFTDGEYEPFGLRMNLTPKGGQIITPKKKNFKGATVDFNPSKGKLTFGLVYDE